MKTGKVMVGVGLLVLRMAWGVYAQPPEIEWVRDWGLDASSGYSVKQTIDGGYIFTGVTGGDPEFGCDVALVKTDSQGNMQWHREFGYEFTNEYGYSVQVTTDGGFILAVSAGDTDIIKTNNQGLTIWTRGYGGQPYGMGARDVRQTTDGGYIVFGTLSYSGSSDLYLVKTDSIGDTLWTRCYGGPDYEGASEVQQTTDGGYIMLGTTRITQPYIYDIFLVKTDSLGDTVWTRTFGGTENEWAYSIQQTFDGGYIIAGASSSFGTGACTIYLIKTDSMGDTLWTRCYGGQPYRYANSIIQTSDEGYFMGGDIHLGSDYGAYFLRTNERGDTLYSITYYNSYNGNSIAEIQHTDDQGYIAVGGTIWDENNYTTLLVKIAPDTFIYNPEIQVSDSLIDFGSVVVGENSTSGLTIYNTGNGYLIIHDLTTNDSSFTTNYNSADSLIPPRDSLEITITFAPQDTVLYLDTLWIDNNDELVYLVLRGVGIPPNAISPEPTIKMLTEFALEAVYPNPFNTSTSISYDIPIQCMVTLNIYDILGRKVATLVDREIDGGRYRVVWEAENLPSGIYFIRMRAGEFGQTRKMVLLK
jgi:hypothetical protein